MISLDSTLLLQITQLWEEISAFKWNESDLAMQRFLQRMLELLDANSLVWVPATARKHSCAVPSVELFGEWFLFDSIYVGPRSEQEQSNRYKQFIDLKKINGVDLLTQNIVNHFGKTKAHLRSDFIPDKQWADYWLLKDFYHEVGTGDVLHSVTNIDASCEACIIVQSKGHHNYFTERDRHILHFASSGILYLHKRLMLLRGATSPSSQLFTPQECLVLKALLEAKQAKEIAKNLGISASTVNKHIASIYRKCGVLGKTELLSLFVS